MNLIVPTILIAVSIAGFFLYINPQYSNLSDLKDNRGDYIEAINRANETKEKYEQAKDWRSAIRQNDIERINEILPDTFDNVEFLIDLNDLAVENRISLGNVGITEGEDSADGYVTHRIDFIFNAPYSENAIDFLKDLENSLTILDIQDFSIRADEGEDLGYSLVFNTYSLK